MSDELNSQTPRTLVPRIFCRSCRSPLVQATDWEQEDGSHWWVRLWCPECGSEQRALLDQPQVTYLSLAIEEGFACVLEALAELQDAALSPRVGGPESDPDMVGRARSERIEPNGM